tara:strand:- start:3195 stop:3434 length:240 start_codon:yes stop_codon:yes gene_type:complete
MCCHKHGIEDFDLQIQMNKLDMSLLCEDGELLAYHKNQYEELRQKELKLLTGKRYHTNASHCYWYWLQREGYKNKTEIE